LVGGADAREPAQPSLEQYGRYAKDAPDSAASVEASKEPAVADLVVDQPPEPVSDLERPAHVAASQHHPPPSWKTILQRREK
jgi:hypothetical protein